MEKYGFDGYLRLKNKYNFIKHGIRLNHVLALQLLQLTYKQINLRKIKLKHILSLINKTLDITPFKNAFATHDIVTSYIIVRNDYQELTENYFKGCDYTTIHLPALIYKKKVSVSNILHAFIFVLFKWEGGSLKEKIYLASYLVYYLNILNTLEQTFRHINLSSKKYIPFNSSFDLESLFVLYFHTKNVGTYHISHALSYVKYSTTGFDAINGENITAAQVLVWGETSKDDLVKNYGRDADVIKVAGNPKYPRKVINARIGFKNGIVFLGGPIYDDDNVILIELIGKIANKYGMNFTIKAHPASNLDVFADTASRYGLALLAKGATVKEILHASEYDFAVAYNSTVYFEAMYYNLVCLRYAVNENGAFNGLDDKFYDEASFYSQLQHFKKYDMHLLNREMEQALINNLGMGINNYENIFNN